MIYELNKEEHEKHVREPDVYWVSDLVRCLLKKEYEMRYPELSLREIFIPYYVSGNLIHRGLQSILKERFGDSVKTEVECVKELTLPDGGKAVVKGRVDALMLVDEVKIGIEIKTSRSDANLPHEQHLEQVMIYNWMMDLNYSLLVYITPERVAQFTVFDRVSEYDVVNRITNAVFPRYVWECTYCAYSVLCPYKKHVSSR